MKDERIRLNVGGTPFHCYKSTLNTFPDSRLAKIATVPDGLDISDDYDTASKEYFYDRNPLMFCFILEACRTGSLHLLRDLCGKTIRDEMSFWEVPVDAISECCWKIYYKSESEIQDIEDLTDNYFRNTNLCHLFGGRQTLKMRLWLFLDEPRTSKFAMMWAAVVVMATILSVFVSAAETLDAVRVPLDPESEKAMERILDLMGLTNSSDNVVRKFHTRLMPEVMLLDVACFVLITADIIVRLFACPSTVQYLRSAVHVCEIAGVVDFWIVFGLEWNIDKLKSDALLWFLLVCKAFVFLKVVRLFRLCRYIPALNIMGLSVRKSQKEIYALAAVLLMLVFVFGYLMISIELFLTDSFDNSFEAMYWAVITLTTVGYGDVHPTSAPGRVLACVCAVCGLIMLALPVGVIAANFNSLYSHHRYAERHIRKHQITSVGNQRFCTSREKSGT